jgi:PAS domain S-box-containing protein
MQNTDTLLKAWVDTVKDYAIFLLDAAGNVSSWNDGAERILGYGEAEILGQPVARVFTPEDRRGHVPECEMGEALSSGHAADDRWHVRKDGSRFWASGVLTLLRDDDGKPCGFVKALRDLTERKRMEEELRRRADALEEVDRRKNDFIAMLSHELRSPLWPVLNSVYLLREHHPTDDPVVVQATATIERQVVHLKRLVDDLLDVARVATHKIQLHEERVVLADVVVQSAADVGELMAERQHELTVTVAPEPIVLEADPVRLRQIIVNLLTNAAKYTDPGGSVWLTARREDGEAVVRVRDTGIGIDAKMLPTVFDLYAQAEASLGRAQGGLGIGLSLTRGLVELHGGRIEATSEGPGRGSEFVVRLPALPEAATSTVEASPERDRPEIRPLRVLIVDDNADTARSLDVLLRLAGHEAHIAHDGPTAVEMVRDHQPDVVLLDIGLPGMNGYEVARAIRQLSAAPLVAMTGFAREKGAGDDFAAYLIKPADPDEILEVLARLSRAR